MIFFFRVYDFIIIIRQKQPTNNGIITTKRSTEFLKNMYWRCFNRIPSEFRTPTYTTSDIVNTFRNHNVD